MRKRRLSAHGSHRSTVTWKGFAKYLEPRKIKAVKYNMIISFSEKFKDASFQDFDFIFLFNWNELYDKLYQLITKDELEKTYLEQSMYET